MDQTDNWRREYALSWAQAALEALKRGDRKECHDLLYMMGTSLNPQVDIPPPPKGWRERQQGGQDGVG